VEVIAARQGPEGLIQPTIGYLPFVGRDAELDRLTTAFAAAASGLGRLVLVAGEPGIGKSALCQRLAASVTAEAGLALLGRCDDAGALSVPYLPFVEALRAALGSHDPAALVHDLGSLAVDAVRLVPELRDRLPGRRPPGVPADPVEARYRLLQAAVAFLRSVSATTPVLLVLEDLQDADHGTLDLLVHLGRHLADMRLLVVGTYRDTDVDGRHPLARALAALRRSLPIDRVHLGGLSPDAVQALIDRIAERPLAARLARAVYDQTEGNPLFVWEVMRQRLDRDRFLWGTPLGRGADPEPVPAGLAEVIGTRLARLSPACQEVLTVAAVIGREFSLATVQAVTGQAPEQVAVALAEAVRMAVLEEQLRVGGARYRFAHALFRQTLYANLPASERLRRHPQVGRALEELYGPRCDDHAAELAEHFARSTSGDDLGRALEYSRRAAAHALAVSAAGEAARLLAHALAIQEVLAPDDRALRCDLLIDAGQVLTDAGQARQVLDEVAPEAFRLAETLADAERASAVCRLAMAAVTIESSTIGLSTPEAVAWAERADRWAPPETAARVWADTFRGVQGFHRERWFDGMPYLTRALALARRLDEPETLWWAAWLWMGFAQAPRHADAQLRLAEEFAARPRGGVTSRTLAYALGWIAAAFLSRGLRGRAEVVWRELEDLAGRSEQPLVQLFALRGAAARATLDGRLEDAIAIAEQALAIGAESGMLLAAQQVAPLLGQRALLHLGRAEEALRLAHTTPSRVLALAHLGRRAEVAAHLDELVLGRPGFGTAADETATYMDVFRLEAAVLVGHRPAAAKLVERLAASGHVTTGIRLPTCIARHLGAACALLGRPDALAHYRAALDLATAIGFRPEIALCQLGLAELLLMHVPRERGAVPEHLAAATDELAAMGMAPALAQARELAARLGASGGQGGTPAGLTPREVEILRLVAAGKSNDEIATALVVSIRTAERHLSNIYAKLGTGGTVARATATAFAHTHGLVAPDTP
jgi:DNA-binding CsgD family transcriptional regulator